MPEELEVNVQEQEQGQMLAITGRQREVSLA